jgi:hypothetical protein
LLDLIKKTDFSQPLLERIYISPIGELRKVLDFRAGRPAEDAGNRCDRRRLLSHYLNDLLDLISVRRVYNRSIHVQAMSTFPNRLNPHAKVGLSPLRMRSGVLL